MRLLKWDFEWRTFTCHQVVYTVVLVLYFSKRTWILLPPLLLSTQMQEHTCVLTCSGKRHSLDLEIQAQRGAETSQRWLVASLWISSKAGTSSYPPRLSFLQQEKCTPILLCSRQWTIYLNLLFLSAPGTHVGMFIHPPTHTHTHTHKHSSWFYLCKHNVSTH